jgi:GGDEF domain-containing protein
MIHIAKYTQAYKQDIITFDETKMTQDDYNRCLIDVIEKDTITNAYNKSFIEDILLHEMARSQRYKIDLSLLCIEIPYDTKDDILKMIGINVLERIRVNDYFGKISEVRYIIITSNTSLSGAIVLAEKLLLDIEEKNPIKLFCGVTEISDSDTMDSVFDKIDDALSRAILKDGQQIEVEV